MMTITARRASAFAALICAGGLQAQELSLPQGAVMTAETVEDPAAYALPTAPWQPETGLATTRIEGRVALQAWRIDGTGLTPLQLLAPLRAQLEGQGFTPVLDCRDRTCGGFDFRFETRVLPAPAMRVDLTNYHFLASERGTDAVSILASRDRNAGYLQIIRAGGSGNTVTNAPAASVERRAPAPGSLPARLEAEGHTILSDLTFQTGSAALAEGPVASLDAIAAYLKANPDRRILFVGHTDAVGSPEGNQTLSRRRAQSAVDYLQERHALAPPRIGAEGVGFLAPIATNLTEAGRDANRRVEAVLISTD